MFKNYLKVALRNLLKHKTFSIVNITGLAVGIAACILILLWVHDELSYDRFHSNFENLYRVGMHYDYPSGAYSLAISPAPMGEALVEEYPEAVNSTRFFPSDDVLIKYDEEKFFDHRIASVDPAFFDIFDFPLISGDRASVMNNFKSVVLSEQTAVKIFGDINPVGNLLQINDKEYKITGILSEVPANSHLQFDCLVRYEEDKKLNPHGGDNWGRSKDYIYVQLQDGTSYREFNVKIADFHRKRKPQSPSTVELQPISRIHLHHQFEDQFEGHGDIRSVCVFSALAALLLLIACMNFMNLTTARSGVRAKEVGIRRVIGAKRSNLIQQFYGEALIMAFVGFIIALTLVEIFLPVFNNWSGKQLQLQMLSNFGMLGGLLSIAFLTGIMSGSYPAIFLSSFKTVNVLKGKLKSGNAGFGFRKVLVVSQFVITVVSLICVLVIFKQLSFINRIDMGFNRSHVIYIRNSGEVLDKFETFKTELLRNPGIVNVTRGSMPIEGRTGIDRWGWEGKGSEVEVKIHPMLVDYDYLETLDMHVLQGRGFSEKYADNDLCTYVINEKAAEVMGMDAPIGKKMSIWNKEGEIIGVVKDFHYGPLHYEIGPAAMFIQPVGHFSRHRYTCVRIESENIDKTLAFIGQTWAGFAPESNFKYNFLDDTINNFYKYEMKMSTLLNDFTILGIFVACLGLFGLSAFLAERRTKEIGIRKVLGAAVANIMGMMSREFLLLVALANIIAFPIAYFMMNAWLNNFAYKVQQNPLIYLEAGIIAIAIAIATISCQTIRAASADPVKSLRCE